MNNGCWHKKVPADSDDVDSNIPWHKSNIILLCAFSPFSCRYDWSVCSHELLHTQVADATHGNDEQQVLVEEEDLVVCSAVVEEEASTMHA